MSKDKPREYRTGSIYQRHDTPACPPLEPGPPHPKTGKPTKVRPLHECAGLWVATIDAGWTEKGTRRRITVAAKTEKDVKKKLRDRRLQLERDGDTGVSAKTTVKAWAEEWLTEQERTLRPSSYSTTRSSVTKWIIPTIGHKRFDLLTPKDVRAVAQAQRAAGRSSSTELRTHSVLMSLLKAAAIEGHAVAPRLLLVKPPAAAVNNRQAMTVLEALAVLEEISRLPHGSRFVAALLQGMRQGESLGLTWPEVDLDRGLLTISWQLQSLRYKIPRDRSSGFRVPAGYEARQVKGSLHLVRPKSKSGWRVIPLVPWMRAALLAWKEIAPTNDHQLVWPNLDGGPTYYKTDDEEWYALQGAASLADYEKRTELAPLVVGHPAGRYYTIHEARHTTATLLLEADVDEATIIAILGHSSIVSTRGYQHVATERALEALGRVAERLQLG